MTIKKGIEKFRQFGFESEKAMERFKQALNDTEEYWNNQDPPLYHPTCQHRFERTDANWKKCANCGMVLPAMG